MHSTLGHRRCIHRCSVIKSLTLSAQENVTCASAAWTIRDTCCWTNDTHQGSEIGSRDCAFALHITSTKTRIDAWTTALARLQSRINEAGRKDNESPSLVLLCNQYLVYKPWGGEGGIMCADSTWQCALILQKNSKAQPSRSVESLYGYASKWTVSSADTCRIHSNSHLCWPAVGGSIKSRNRRHNHIAVSNVCKQILAYFLK